MKCPSCGKMAANDSSSEPEIDLDDPAYNKEDRTIEVTGTARIVIMSECCGDELKEATFDIDSTLDIGEGKACECDEFSIDDYSAEIIDEYESQKTRTLKDGTVKVTEIPSRYQKHFYGIHVEFTIKCTCGQVTVSGDFEDKIAASAMDELV